MAPPLRTMMALCAPAALVAFVVRPNPGSSVIRAPASVPAAATSNTQKQRVGPLFAKPLAYEVTHKPAANSSIILNLDVPGETTQLCYDKAIRALSKEAGNSIPGFGNKGNKGNTKHPPEVIERHFGMEEVKGQSLKVISELVVNEAINSLDLQAIGSAELVQDISVVTQLFTPGVPMMLEVKMDVWPEVNIVKEYTGFELEVEEPPIDEPRVAAAWKGLQERNVVLEDTEEGYAAQLGDSVIANMMPFRENADGSKGEQLPNIASGDGVDIVLESGRYMPGLAEGMEGVKAGETREIRITFPDKLGPQGGDLEGTKAVFEVEAVEVMKRNVPEVNEEFAQSIREGLTLEELTTEVEKAVMEETGTSKRDTRNKAYEEALLETCSITIPETLIVEQAREKFAIMMTEFKDQGESDAKIQSMITKEAG
ncbi:Trigger factor (TF) [Ectocarpus siliculosus]|uniref:peptidylprolyl isomerase n=1 Tax=Ectocarpus siliculosus TaxID=2880 RepID=D7FZQ0_ECTSI|nr:Trigger factor (TF) [Ectocarpus siliculosus]|eukprot:CBJ32857.1 Trigger factor (TF) [Ectocarpus siliculosus]